MHVLSEWVSSMSACKAFHSLSAAASDMTAPPWSTGVVYASQPFTCGTTYHLQATRDPQAWLSQAAAAAAPTQAQTWVDALVGLHGALLQGRRFVWMQAHRAISLLAMSPQALQPEHLVQVPTMGTQGATQEQLCSSAQSSRGHAVCCHDMYGKLLVSTSR